MTHLYIVSNNPDPGITELARRVLARALRLSVHALESSEPFPDFEGVTGDVALSITEGAYKIDRGERGRRIELRAAQLLDRLALNVREITSYEPGDGP